MILVLMGLELEDPPRFYAACPEERPPERHERAPVALWVCLGVVQQLALVPIEIGPWGATSQESDQSNDGDR